MSMVSVIEPPSRAIQGSGSERPLNLLAVCSFREEENCLTGLAPISDCFLALLRADDLYSYYKVDFYLNAAGLVKRFLVRLNILILFFIRFE